MKYVFVASVLGLMLLAAPIASAATCIGAYACSNGSSFYNQRAYMPQYSYQQPKQYQYYQPQYPSYTYQTYSYNYPQYYYYPQPYYQSYSYSNYWQSSSWYGSGYDYYGW